MPSNERKEFYGDSNNQDEKYILRKTLFQIYEEKENLNKKQKENKGQTLLQALTFIIVLSGLNLLILEQGQFFGTFILVELATIILILVLYTQFTTLREEIKEILGELESTNSFPGLMKDQNFEFETHPELLTKVYDVRKNTIDKMFEKLGTFSNTWLVLTGGLASSLIVEIFKSSTNELYPSLAIVVCALLLWDIAQNLYGILNYELMKKTKDLAYWWIAKV